MIYKMRLTLFVLVLGLGLNAAALAQNYVVFNGGITAAERAAAPKEGTKLSFFVQAGNYLANVSVVVRNEAGNEVVNTVAEGPWLILNLPNGTYRVDATISSGETQSVTINVDGGNREVGFMFKSVQ